MSKHPDYLTIGEAARALGRTRGFVKRAIDRGLLRHTSEPFKSNLNPQGSSTLILVSAVDIRDAISGVIDLTPLEDVPVVGRSELPKDMVELAEMMTDIKRCAEQTGVMTALILERMDITPPKPKKDIK